MEHRAGPLLANRSLSALIVVSFVLSAFAGLYMIASPPQSAAQAPIGNLIVATGTTYTIENIEQPVDGYVEVRSGATLIVKNGSLKVINDMDLPRTITVLAGGTLILEHGEITTYLDQIDPWPFLTIIIGGGTVVASDMSALRFPGEILIHSGGELILRNSYTDSLSPEELATISSSPYFTSDSIDDGPAISVDDSSLMMFDSAVNKLPEYPSISAVASNLTLTGSSDLLAVNSYFSIDFGPKVAALLYEPNWYTHNMLDVQDTSQAYLYGCVFEDYTDTYALRAPAINVAAGADAYIHRWLDVTVGDEYGVPIPGADVSAVFTGNIDWEGDDLFYYTPTGASPTPPAEVMEYLGKTTETMFVTDSNGLSRIPFMTDVITNDGDVESVFTGSYAITGSTVIEATPYSSNETYSFPAYPAMASTDQYFEMTVEIADISAESPNTARWLVVPPNLLIDNMDFYHAGDVIVAADGILTVRNSVFQLVQASPNERTVYIDGPSALFMIDESEVVSSLPINIIVKGSGTLHVRNSVLTGVDIVAMEDATVILDGVTLSGSITTSWDSRAHIQILDSALQQAPEISGTTLCEVTNTSAPSIAVTDSAVALIYRWIHVTVFDGSNYPLEGADVYTRFFVNETHWATQTTDSNGVARLNSLATILTSSGSTYVGNYKVNASYWTDTEEYVSDEVALGVLPYDQPLTENATYAVLRISSLFLPDLSISSSSIWTTPSSVVLDSECTISVSVANVGAAPAEEVVVDFYLGDELLTAELIGSYTIDLIMPGTGGQAMVAWTPEETELHTIWVYVNDGPVFDERTLQNNLAWTTVDVLNYADLTMGSMTFYLQGGVLPQTSIPGESMITVKADLGNIGEAPVTNPEVELTVTYGTTVDTVRSTVIGVLASGGTFHVSVDYQLPEVNESSVFNFRLSANPDREFLEANYSNNNVSGNLNVLDVREDFKVSVEDIYIQYGPDNETDPVYGQTVTIVAHVYNLGGTNPGNVTIQVGNELYPSVPIANVSESINPGMMREIRVNYLINLTTGGTYTLYVFADCDNEYDEKNESNNRAEFDFAVDQLSVTMTMSPSAEYSAGETIYVVVDVFYSGTSVKVPQLRGVSIALLDSDDEVVVASEGVYTTPDGQAAFSMTIPSELESGTYTLVATVAGLTDTTSATLEIHGTVSGMDIPWLVWVIVIAAIAAVVVGFTLYTYKFGLGKLVECGECGEFIPAASKRCPKCGVEFEAGTMKCSECGAWVPAESTECPNCGVKFVGEEVAEEDYLEKMRKEYDEMVSKYRELAKAQLGRKFNDKTFEQWWTAQPIYISFEDWLAKEEEKRKEGPVACPVCGTLNPKEATVCSKCGTVFGAPRQAPPQQQPPQTPPGAAPEQARPQAAPPEYQQPPADQAGQPPQQAAAPKMVIRRPIDRKVVPKKVIKTPIEGQGENSEGGESQ